MSPVICFFFGSGNALKGIAKASSVALMRRKRYQNRVPLKGTKRGPVIVIWELPQVIMAPNSIQFRELRGRGKALEQLVTDKK